MSKKNYDRESYDLDGVATTKMVNEQKNVHFFNEAKVNSPELS